MSINKNQLQLLIIRPILKEFEIWSQSAENLLMGTCAQESAMGTYLQQVMGPAVGIYQMEMPTYYDLWKNSIKQDMKDKILKKFSDIDKGADPKRMLIVNLEYATLMARIKYLICSDPLPEPTDIEGLALYWKEHYNSRLGAGKVDDFIKNYNRYVK